MKTIKQLSKKSRAMQALLRRSAAGTLGVAALLVLTYSAPAQVLVDFGPDNGGLDGVVTASPDANGNYWNNMTSITVGASLTNLVTTNNQPSTIALTLGAGVWAQNGIRNGGLTNPATALLGIFAVPTATEDYIFLGQTYGTPDGTAQMLISGLDPARSYNLSMFASRNITSTRTTTYSVSDANGTHSVNLVTSGTSANSGTNPSNIAGNDKTIASLNGLVPNLAGQLTFLLIVGDTGDCAYLAEMLISPGPSITPVPTPILLQDTSPSRAETVVGDQISFTASFNTSPAATYQWQFISGGVTNDISGATSSTITLNNLQVTNSGAYRLKGINATNSQLVAYSTPSLLTVSSVPAAVDNIIVEDAGQWGSGTAGISTNFYPSWTPDIHNDLILGTYPSDFGPGDFGDSTTGNDPALLTDGFIGYLNYWPGVGGSPT